MSWKNGLIMVLAPLFLGGIVYWLTRGNTPPVFFRWLHIPPSPVDLNSFLPRFIVFTLPSFCWTFSLTSLLFLIWQCNDREHKIWLGSIAFVGSVLFEVMQVVGVFPGTFDWGDIFSSALASVLVFFISTKHQS